MKKQLLLASALAIPLAYSPARSQPEPRDGTNLAPTDLERVKVGQAAPDFTLEDTDGTNITLSEYRDKKNVVLVFYRGHW